MQIKKLNILKIKTPIFISFRALKFCESVLNGVVPEMKLDEEDKKVLAKINREVKEYCENLEKIRSV